MIQLVNYQLLLLVLPISNSPFLLKERYGIKTSKGSTVPYQREELRFVCFRHMQSNPGNIAQGRPPSINGWGAALGGFWTLWYSANWRNQSPLCLPPWLTPGICAIKGCTTPFVFPHQGQAERKACTKNEESPVAQDRRPGSHQAVSQSTVHRTG